jgi:hypothetical protein
MDILFFKNINYNVIQNKDLTERDIGFTYYNDCIITGRNNYYPNVLIFSNDNIISPYDEKIMSLNKNTFYDDNKFNFVINNQNKNTILEPVFFFIYNFDNYYHFIYDTLPYLYIYKIIKNTNPSLKLLVNYPNKFKNEFYKFNIEFLNKLVNINDIIIHENNNFYKTIFIGSSLTHGGFSNNSPRIELYNLLSSIKYNTDVEFPKKIYISRRTWKNNDNSNIGTNYTTRRKMINEDELVNKLTELGFTEIFAENLTTDEKIKLFSNAEFIIGTIGGGMTNLLFSNKNVKSIIIVTPYFLDINYRFNYVLQDSFNNPNINYFYDTLTYKNNNNIPLFCRVKIHNNIGEIIEYKDNKYLINISDNDIAGFNNEFNYKNDWYFENEFELIDNGLNSPYIVNTNKLIDLYLLKK